MGVSTSKRRAGRAVERGIGKGESRDEGDVSAAQDGGAGPERRPGGDHVVDQEDASPGGFRRDPGAQPDGGSEPDPAPAAGQTGLGRRREPGTTQPGQAGPADVARDGGRQQVGLVESSGGAAQGGQGHRDDDVERFRFSPRSPCRRLGDQFGGQEIEPAELQGVDHLLEWREIPPNREQPVERRRIDLARQTARPLAGVGDQRPQAPRASALRGDRSESTPAARTEQQGCPATARQAGFAGEAEPGEEELREAGDEARRPKCRRTHDSEDDISGAKLAPFMDLGKGVRVRRVAVFLGAIVWLGAAQLHAQSDSIFTVSVLGGIAGSFDQTQSQFTQTALQVGFGVETDERTLTTLRLGRLDLGDNSVPGRLGATLDYAVVAGEYRFREPAYDAGIFLGLGAYRLDGSSPVAHLNRNTALGVALGVTGDFDLTRHVSFVAEVDLHYAFLGETDFYGVALGGVAIHF